MVGLVGLAAAAATCAMFDFDAVLSVLAGADVRFLVVAIAAAAVGQTLSGAMWSTCQRAGGVRGIPISTTLGLHWIARAASELLPANLGEAVRVAIVRRHPAGRGAGAWRITGGIGGYKAIDAAVTTLVVSVVVLIAPLPGPASALRATMLAIVIALIVAAVAWRLARPRLGKVVPARFRGAAGRLGAGARVLLEPVAASQAALLGLGAIGARMISLGALLAAVGAPPQAAPLVFAVVALAGLLPLAPGGAGSREALLIPTLALAFGVPGATALALSLAIQAVALGTSLIIGAAALAWLGPSLRGPRTESIALPLEPALSPT